MTPTFREGKKLSSRTKHTVCLAIVFLFFAPSSLPLPNPSFAFARPDVRPFDQSPSDLIRSACPVVVVARSPRAFINNAHVGKREGPHSPRDCRNKIGPKWFMSDASYRTSHQGSPHSRFFPVSFFLRFWHSALITNRGKRSSRSLIVAKKGPQRRPLQRPFSLASFGLPLSVLLLIQRE